MSRPVSPCKISLSAHAFPAAAFYTVSMNILIALLLSSFLFGKAAASGWEPTCTLNDKAPIIEQELEITWIQPWNIELSKEANRDFRRFNAMLDDLERIGMRPRRDRITQKNGEYAQNYVKAAGETLQQIMDKADHCRENLEKCKLWVTNLNHRSVFSARSFEELGKDEFDRIFSQYSGEVLIPMTEFQLDVSMEPSPLYRIQKMCDETRREGYQSCHTTHIKALISKTLTELLEHYGKNIVTNRPGGMSIGCDVSTSEYTLTSP